jgi:succinate-semialdehyde dehydrogenase/glutarate-semialdehyde dehydrogenase
VAEIAGRHLKKVVLELGGSDPLLLLDSADIAASAKQAFGSRMANVGQACNSPKRMIVTDELFDGFVAEIVALAQRAADSGRLAPLSSRAAAEGVHAQVASAVDAGATLHTGGTLSEVGAFLTPAVLTEVTRDMDVFHEEVFGPVVVVHRVPDADAAIELANDSTFGLGAAVFSQDEALARSVAERLDCGMVFVNGVEDSEPDLPFGGVRRSGFGRELGAFGVDEFANRKLIRLP